MSFQAAVLSGTAALCFPVVVQKKIVNSAQKPALQKMNRHRGILSKRGFSSPEILIFAR